MATDIMMYIIGAHGGVKKGRILIVFNISLMACIWVQILG